MKEVREGNGWRDEENKNLMSTYYGARHYVICFPTMILSTQQSEAVQISVLVVQTSKLRLGKVQWPHSEAV